MIGELCRTHHYTASRLRQQPVAAGNGGWLQQLFKGRTLVLQSWRNVFDKLNKTYTNLTQLSFLRRGGSTQNRLAAAGRCQSPRARRCP